MKALDEHIPEPKRDVDKPYLMPIEDIFSIEGRGTVVTGRIERGIVNLNDEVEIYRSIISNTVSEDWDIEQFHIEAPKYNIELFLSETAVPYNTFNEGFLKFIQFLILLQQAVLNKKLPK